MKIKAALLYGGQSAEREVSAMGFPYVDSLLRDGGYDVLAVYIDEGGSWFLKKDGSDERVFPYRIGKRGVLLNEDGKIHEIDVAIPLLHGNGGESGEIQGLLSAAAIPYVGSDVSSGAICLDKHYTKCVALELGIPVAKWLSFTGSRSTDEALDLCRNALGFPMFIKPRRLGSSIGAGVARCAEEFRTVFSLASRVGNGLVIVEELFENKRELECAFFSALGRTEISPPGEVLSPGFYGYEEKYNKGTETLTLADVNKEVTGDVRRYSRQLADALRLRHLGRIDYFLTERGVVLNEINTFPGFTKNSLYPRMLKAMGIPPAEALRLFIEDALLC